MILVFNLELCSKMSKELGQYFTKSIILKTKVSEFILNDPDIILEPSVGRGDLVEYIILKNSKVQFDMYEIDDSIEPLNLIPKEDIIYGDFLSLDITKRYDTIVGNPPYVRTKKGNLYIDFISKCFSLLNDNGELIFIVPSDFMKLTSASGLLNTMMLNGTFTHIYHPHDETLFDNASIDVIVFRYAKNHTLPKTVIYEESSKVQMNIINNNGMITFLTGYDDKKYNETKIFSAYFDIYVGMVSGKEEVYKHPELGNIDVLNGDDKIDKYIYLENKSELIGEVGAHLLSHKTELLERGIRKFNENNWFEWGAPRNIKAIQNNLGKECIYVHTLTRKECVAFVGKVMYFGGGLLMLIPKNDVDLIDICKHINSQEFRRNFIFSGRFKIGHRQISNSLLPDF
jgi:adenine-specific DNA-methyltransferase